MASRGKKKVQRIHRALWEKAQEESPLRQVDFRDADMIVGDIAGYDDRTKDKYFEILKRKGIIEEKISKLGRFRISKPESEEVERKGLSEKTVLSIDQGLKEEAKDYGLNLSNLLEQAIVERVKDMEEYVNEIMENDYDDNEVEMIRKLVDHDLYKKGGAPEDEHNKDKQRRHFYKDIFDVDKMTSEEHDHLEELRKRAFKLAEEMRVE